MLVSNDYLNKRLVVTVTENDSMKEAIKTLIDSGYRCVPVLDETEEKYIGNIYKVDLLRYETENNSEALEKKITELIQVDDSGTIREDDAFFKVFSNIKRLPFLAVINKDDDFLGILTNGNVIQVLENAWGVHNGSFSLTIGTIEYSGVLTKMLKIVNKYCNVQSVISLNNDSKYVRRVSIVLPEDVDEETANKIAKDLEHNNLTVTDIEKLS